MSLFEAKKWEAPDKKFIGHRDCMVRNMSRYHFIASRAKGRCLDIGCGRGYGFHYLKRPCASCTGLDISEAFLKEAREQYPGVVFVHQNAETLPFGDASFDTITSFEVIEHIENDNGFLREIVRVGTPGALVAISTPNRLVTSGDRKKPLNKFHVREYVADEFRELLDHYFAEVTLYGQSDARDMGGGTESIAGSFTDRVPVRLKYLVPFYVQDVISVLLRSPLQMEDCHFCPNAFERAHTLYAVCRVSDK